MIYEVRSLVTEEIVNALGEHFSEFISGNASEKREDEWEYSDIDVLYMFFVNVIDVYYIMRTSIFVYVLL